MVSKSKKNKKKDPPQVNYSLRTRGRNICRNQISNDKTVKSQIDVLARQELNKSQNKDSWKELSLLSEENFNKLDSPIGSSLPLLKRRNMSSKKLKRKSGLFNLNLTSYQRHQHLLKEFEKSSRQRHPSASESGCGDDGSETGSENVNVVQNSSKHYWKINCVDISVKDNANDEFSSDELIIDEDIVPPSQDNWVVSHTSSQIDNTLFYMSKDIVTNKSVKYFNQSLDQTECAGNKTAFQVDSNDKITETEIQDSDTLKSGSNDLFLASNYEKQLSLQLNHMSDSSVSNDQNLKRTCFKTRKKQNFNPLEPESSPEKVCSNKSLSLGSESPKKFNNLQLSEGLSAEKSKIFRDLFFTNNETSPEITIQSFFNENISDFNSTPKKLTDSDYESSSGTCSNKKESSPDTLSFLPDCANISGQMTTNESFRQASDSMSKGPFDCYKVTDYDLVDHSQRSVVTTENRKLRETSSERIASDQSLIQNMKSPSGTSSNNSNTVVDQSFYESQSSPEVSSMVEEEMPSNKCNASLDESLANSHCSPSESSTSVEMSPPKSNIPLNQQLLKFCSNFREEIITDKVSIQRNHRSKKEIITDTAFPMRTLRPRKANLTNKASVEKDRSPTKAERTNKASVKRNLSPTKVDMNNEASADKSISPIELSMTDGATAERNLSPTKVDMNNEASADESLSSREVSMTDVATVKRYLRPRKASLTNKASAGKSFSPKKVSTTDGATVERKLRPRIAGMTAKVSTESSNNTLDQSLSNRYNKCCKNLSFDEETSLEMSKPAENVHPSLNNMSMTSEISSKTHNTDESLSNASSTCGNTSECFENSQNNIIDEDLSNAHHDSPAKPLVQGNAQMEENADDEILRITPIHLETSKIPDESPKYNLRKRIVSTGSESLSSSKSPKNSISTSQSSGKKQGVRSKSSCSPGNSRVNHLNIRQRNDEDSDKSKEPPVKRKYSKGSDDDDTCSQSDTEISPKRNRSSSRGLSQSRKSIGENESTLEVSTMDGEMSESKTKDPDLIETIGKHKINITKIVNKAFSKWRLPLKVLKKVQAIDTELIWNSERMFKNIKNTNKTKNKKKQVLHEEDLKLIYRRWSEFCRLYNFNRKKPRYFFNTPIVNQYFSPNFLKYFTAFLSQDLAHCPSRNTVLRNFQYLFDGDDIDFSAYSEYEDSVILALHKKLSGKVNYVNRIAAFALGKSYLSVCKRHLKIRNISNGSVTRKSPKARNVSRTKDVNKSKSDSEIFNSDDETSTVTPDIQITEERLECLKNKSEKLFRLFDAMLEISGHSRASAHEVLEKDFSVKDWQRIADKIGNIPAHVAKALFMIKVHPLLTSTQAINKYQLISDILNHLKSKKYKCWEDVKWTEMSGSFKELKPLFIFATFGEFVRIHVPGHLQENYKDCMDYLLKEKLDFIKHKIKEKIILDICE